VGDIAPGGEGWERGRGKEGGEKERQIGERGVKIERKRPDHQLSWEDLNEWGVGFALGRA